MLRNRLLNHCGEYCAKQNKIKYHQFYSYYLCSDFYLVYKSTSSSKPPIFELPPTFSTSLSISISLYTYTYTYTYIYFYFYYPSTFSTSTLSSLKCPLILIYKETISLSRLWIIFSLSANLSRSNIFYCFKCRCMI